MRRKSARAMPGVTEDRLLGGRVRLRQPDAGYRVAIDTPLLAAAVPAKPGESALELGCGVGGAALCLLAREPAVAVTGIEPEPLFADLARQNAALNGAAERFSVVQGSLLGLPSAALPAETFDHLFCNPPFAAPGRGNRPGDALGRAARVEGAADLAAWMRVATVMLRRKGSLTVVHRADRLAALLAALPGSLGGVTLFPLWPSAPGRPGAKPAKRLLLRARKGVATPPRIAPGLVLHDETGGFTPDADAVLRGGRALIP